MRPGLPILAGIGVAMVAFSAPSSPARAASDCAGVTPVNNALGFRARDNSERCEGLYVADVAGDGVEIVSLTYGRIAFGGALRLQLDTTSDQLAATTLFGVGICGGAHYLMRAHAPEMPFSLPTGADSVIARAECHPDDIGFFAMRSDAGGSDLFIPVHVAAKDQPEPGVARLEVTLATESDVRDAEWRVTGDRAAGAYQRVPGPRTILALQPVRFEAPTPSRPSFGLELRYTLVRNGERRPRRFDISLR